MAKRILKEAIDRFYDYDILTSTRTLFMGSMGTEGEDSGTDFAMAEAMIKGLHILDTTGTSPITIIMNNLGGDEYHGLAIYDAIRACKCEVHIKVFGHAMSMGSIILQAADKRFMSPNSRCMIHYGTWDVPADHPKITRKWAEEGQKFDTWMINMYLQNIREKHPEFNYADVDKLCDFDTILTAQETVDLGLADEVLGES